MSKPHTCHLPDITALFCIGLERLGLVEALPCHGTAIVVSAMTELGGDND